MEQLSAEDLLIFASIATHGSFTAAAERLGLPKSTVSRRLSQLEQVLGERLMTRTTRRLRLTDFGEAMLEHARQISNEIDAAKALAENRQAVPSGRLRVSMPSDLANLLLPQALAAFSALHPAVQLELDLSARRVDLLGEGFDLAIRMGDLPDDALLAARRLAVFPSGLFAAPGYLAEHGEPDSPEALHKHRALLLASGGSTLGWTLSRDGHTWEGRPPANISANSPELLLELACQGAGIASAPAFFAQPYVGRGQLRRILPAWSLPSNTAWAVFPGRRLMPAKTRAFIDMLLPTLASA